jgi:hypothetical protein
VERIKERRDSYEPAHLGGNRRKAKLSSDALRKVWRKPSKPE